MRFSKESNHGANAGLQIARDLLEPIKKKYEGCTYADLYTLAGCVAIEAMGGPKIAWRNGRSDAKDESSCPPDGSLPDASQGQDHIRNIFYRMSVQHRHRRLFCIQRTFLVRFLLHVSVLTYRVVSWFSPGVSMIARSLLSRVLTLSVDATPTALVSPAHGRVPRPRSRMSTTDCCWRRSGPRRSGQERASRECR